MKRLSIVKGDIVKMKTDAIVNAANTSLLGGGGVDGAIHRAAGPELLAECETLHGCVTGEAKITKGYNLKAKYIIHTVGPIYLHSENPAQDLKNCYLNSLEVAKNNDIHSIDFPAISCGVYGYPINEATNIAYNTIIEWLKNNEAYLMNVTLSCFNYEIYDAYSKIVE